MKEFRIVIKNKPGTLADLTDVLGRGGINIKAITIETMSIDSGVVHVVTDDSDSAKKVLEKNRIPYGVHDVIAIKIPDRPGELSKVCRKLGNAKININFIYIITKEGDKTTLAIASDKLGEAEKILKAYM